MGFFLYRSWEESRTETKGVTRRAVIGPGGGPGITYRRSGCMLARRWASVCDWVVLLHQAMVKMECTPERLV